MEEMTLTSLRRVSSRTMEAVRRGNPIMITAHGRPLAKITPAPRRDKAALLAALQAIGPIELPPRT